TIVCCVVSLPIPLLTLKSTGFVPVAGQIIECDGVCATIDPITFELHSFTSRSASGNNTIGTKGQASTSTYVNNADTASAASKFTGAGCMICPHSSTTAPPLTLSLGMTVYVPLL